MVKRTRVQNGTGAKASNLLSSTTLCLQILEYVANQGRDVGLMEVANHFSLPKSTVHRMLSTLCALQYLAQNPLTRQYGLGLQTFVLGSAYLRKLELRKVALPAMKQLGEELRLTVNLGMWEGNGVLIVECIPVPDLLTFYSEIGDRLPAHATALGKSMLAFRPQDAGRWLLEKKLQRYSPNTITANDPIRKELKQIQLRGTAVDVEEYVQGCICVAAPIWNASNIAFAAMSVSGPTRNMSVDRVEAVGALVKAAAMRTSLLLGYRRPK